MNCADRSSTASWELPVPGEARMAGLLFLTALLVRLVSWMGLWMFGPDSPSFLFMADFMREGRFQEALSTAYHPMYPLLVAAAGTLTGGSILAGHLVSIFLGAAAVVPLYWIALSTFGKPAAFFAGLFYAFHSPLVEVQSDIMTDGAFMFFFLSSLWLTWKLSEEPSPEAAVVSGLSAAAAFLTRPEGMLAIALAIAWPLLVLGMGGRGAILRRAGGVALSAAVIVIAISPYLFWVRAERGHWAMSPRPSAISAERSAGVTDERVRKIYADFKPDPSLYRKYGSSLLRLNLYGVLFPFHLMGLAALRRERMRRSVFYFLAVLSYMGAVLYVLRKHNAMSDRYLMVPMALLSALAGLGVSRALRFMAERLPSRAWRPAASGALIAAIAVAPGVYFLRTRNSEQRSFPEVARWIRAHGGEGRPISTAVPQVNYLAGRRELTLPNNPEELGRQIETERAQYFMYSERDVRSRPADIAMLRACDRLTPPFEVDVPPGTERVFLQAVKER